MKCRLCGRFVQTVGTYWGPPGWCAHCMAEWIDWDVEE